MYHYLEQQRTRDGLITGRIEVADFTYQSTRQQEIRLQQRTRTGYSWRRCSTARKRCLITPILNPS
nr:hypothetical protein A6C57_01305 [Fibrella sp. ES10-3-2-2]